MEARRPKDRRRTRTPDPEDPDVTPASPTAPAPPPAIERDLRPGPLDEASMVAFELMVVGLALAAAALLWLAR
jgi:hypothetical protein